MHFSVAVEVPSEFENKLASCTLPPNSLVWESTVFITLQADDALQAIGRALAVIGYLQRRAISIEASAISKREYDEVCSSMERV